MTNCFTATTLLSALVLTAAALPACRTEEGEASGSTDEEGDGTRSGTDGERSRPTGDSDPVLLPTEPDGRDTNVGVTSGADSERHPTDTDAGGATEDVYTDTGAAAPPSEPTLTDTETTMPATLLEGTDTGTSDGEQHSDTSTPDDGGDAPLYGDAHQGMYHLGPVDFAETEWHNACAPEGGYRQDLRDGSGLGNEYLAGVSNVYDGGGGICDSCIHIETATGRHIVARVVTYGDTGPEDLDVSPSVYSELNTDEWPRDMSWQLTRCPDMGSLTYEFQTGANIWWTSFWVRNQRVPIATVEVKSSNHTEFFELRRESDGTLNDDPGFGEGEFTLRLTAVDGQVITDTFPAFTAGELIVSQQQFQ